MVVKEKNKIGLIATFDIQTDKPDVRLRIDQATTPKNS